MIEIKQVLTSKQKKQFVDFPVRLYSGSKFFVPPLRMDEIAMFGKKNASWDECDIIFFLAYQENTVVGRIAGIIQKISNSKHNEKKARFSRFDSINDLSVAKALFTAVEEWAKSKGMEKVHGPLGFNDLDREGMLIEGFDQVCTFEEQYNYDYYPVLMEKCGYKKEIDWLEFRIYSPSKISERLERVSNVVMKRYHLHLVEEKSKKTLIKNWGKQIFKIIDVAYSPLHGTVPFNDKMRQQILDQFNLFITKDFIILVADEQNRPIAFGFGIPSLSQVMIDCKGKLNPLSIIKILKAVKKPKIVDLGLIGVIPEYQSKGVNSLILYQMQKRFIEMGIEYCETNLNLENNTKVMQQWNEFDRVEQNKRRRCFVKDVVTNETEEKTEAETPKPIDVEAI